MALVRIQTEEKKLLEAFSLSFPKVKKYGEEVKREGRKNGSQLGRKSEEKKKEEPPNQSAQPYADAPGTDTIPIPAIHWILKVSVPILSVRPTPTRKENKVSINPLASVSVLLTNYTIQDCNL